MHFPTHVVPVAVLLASGQVHAAPLTVNDTILARDYQGYTGCSADQTNMINAALSDAAVLARFVSSNKDGTSSFATGSAAFNNYFPADSWTTGIQAMYTAIGNQWAAPAPINGEVQNPVTLAQFTVIVTCADPNNACKQLGSSSLAITDVTPAGNGFTPSILFCPAFFNDRRTKNNLNSQGYKPNPGRRDGAQWCKPGQKFADFEVAGATVLHELTHLNEAGAAAGLAPNPVDPNDPAGAQTQGTRDIYGTNGYSKDPETAARALHANWNDVTNNNLPEDQWPPYTEKENAEGYAAAALEWWFMQQCGFPSIQGN